jgi:hypothetical protein
MRFQNPKLHVLCDAKCVEGYEKKPQEHLHKKPRKMVNGKNTCMVMIAMQQWVRKLQTYISVADH